MVLRFLIVVYLNISIFFPENVLFAHQKRISAGGEIEGEDKNKVRIL